MHPIVPLLIGSTVLVGAPASADTLTLHNRVGCTDTQETREMAEEWIRHRDAIRTFFTGDPAGARSIFPSCQLVETMTIAPYAEQKILPAAWEVVGPDGVADTVIGETYLDLGRYRQQP